MAAGGSARSTRLRARDGLGQEGDAGARGHGRAGVDAADGAWESAGASVNANASANASAGGEDAALD